MDDIKITIYEYLLKRRDLLDLNRLVWRKTDLEEIKSLEQELEELEKDVNEKYYSIISTEEGYEELLKVENELRESGGVRSWKLDEMYMEAIEERKKESELKTKGLIDKFIEQDKETLELQKCKISIVRKEELEEKLDKEFANYNMDMIYSSKDKTHIITIMEGIDKNGKRVSLYYYPYTNYKDKSLENIVRQIRSFNKNGDIENMTRGSLDGNGEYTEIDSGSIVYQYDRDGNKKVGLYEDDITGVEYFEYDKDGNIKLSISDDHIMQHVKDGEKEYDICDGYFEPSDNGFTYLSHESMYDIETDEIKRMVFGNISKEEKSIIVDELNPERQEKVVDILITMEPIFEYASSFDSLDTEKREKVISWFKGFSKNLKLEDIRIHTSKGIVEEISPREGEIKEVLDETIAEQNRINNQDKEKEGEEIGAN